MSILIDDPELEARIVSLAGRQPIPVAKTTMAKAILREATKDLRKPTAWRRPDDDPSAAKETDSPDPPTPADAG